MTPNQINSLLHSLHLIRAINRCGSFSAAAISLGMSQPAVSQQIAHLEQLLGKVLFERGRRGVRLTLAGHILHDATNDIVETLNNATQRLYETQTRQKLTILTDYGFAAYWLLPRLVSFERKHPNIDVNLLTAQTQHDTKVRHNAHAPDLTILFGDKPHIAGMSPLCLFHEEIIPVCTPDYKHTYGPFTHIEDFLKACLLHLDGPDSKWFSWADWFKSTFGNAPLYSQPRKSRCFGNYPLLLQAILCGQGIGLGWHPLINDLLKTGELIPLHDHYIKSERGYFIVPSSKETPAMTHFIDWATAQGA